jgi:hypothetical protein
LEGGGKKASLSATAKLVNHNQQVHAWVFVSFVLDMVDDKLAGVQYSNNAHHQSAGHVRFAEI